MKKIAILGDGQLADMLMESIRQLPIYVEKFKAPKTNNAGKTCLQDITKYCKKLKNFDIITFEIENIDINLLNRLQKINNKINIYPSIQSLKVSQDRILEKKLFNYLDINTNNYYEVNKYKDLKNLTRNLKYPFILKSRYLGYDGKYQFTINNIEEQKNIWQTVKNILLIAEEYINFDYEISQISSRDKQGNIIYYPLSYNIHKNGILYESKIIKIPNIIIKQIRSITDKLLTYFNYIGTFAIEFFIKNNIVYANEMAPRVHNSGHWSIHGSTASQFKNHMFAILGYNTQIPNINKKYITMINFIGKNIPNNLINHDCLKIQVYGKKLRRNRKMGHVTILTDNKKKFISLHNQVCKITIPNLQ